MEIGVALPHMGPHVSAAGLERLAAVAEELDFHSLWFSDHLIIPVDYDHRYPYDEAGEFPLDHNSPWLDCLTTMTWMAARTERIKLGTSVLVVPYRHPVVLAKQVSAIQYLSRGRFIFGAGGGWMQTEYDTVGVPYQERGKRLDECLDLIAGFCTTSPASYEGRFYHLPAAGVKPLPDTAPEIWIGGETDVALRRAARFQGWQSYQGTTEHVRTAAAKLPDHVTVSVRRRLNPNAMRQSVAELAELRDAGVDNVVVEVWADVPTVEETWRRLAAEFAPALV